jgi:uncharacterized membrane protein YkvA (DUF1232 family)
MKGLIEKLKALAKRIKEEMVFVRLLVKHPQTPFISKFFLALAIGYFFLPFDLIPDWIPVIGQLDDFVVVPLLILIAYKLTPREVIESCRAQTRS